MLATPSIHVWPIWTRETRVRSACEAWTHPLSGVPGVGALYEPVGSRKRLLCRHFTFLNNDYLPNASDRLSSRINNFIVCKCCSSALIVSFIMPQLIIDKSLAACGTIRVIPVPDRLHRWSKADYGIASEFPMNLGLPAKDCLNNTAEDDKNGSQWII